MNIASLTIQMAADVAKLRSDMDAAKSMVSDAMGSIQRAADMAGKALSALGVAASVGGLVDFVQGTIEATAQLHHLSEQAGVSVESLSAMRSVAKLSGTDMGDVVTSLQKLSKSMVDAQGGTGKAAEAFKALGVNIFDSNGQLKQADQVQLEVAKSLQQFKAGATTTAVQIDLMGKSAANLAPYLADLAEKGNLNGKITAEQARQAGLFEKNIIRTQAAIKGWFTGVALDLLPALEKLGGLMKVALEVGAAYLALFYGLPAAYAAAAAAAEAFGASVMAASLATTTLSGSLGLAVGQTMAAVQGFGLLKSAGMLMIAAFAGWQIGKWLTDNFVQARLAGVAFVDGTLTAWEHLKYAGTMFWLALQDIGDAAIWGIGASLSTMAEWASKAMKAFGMGSAGQVLEDLAVKIGKATRSTFDFNAQAAAAKAQLDKNLDAVHAITGDMADYAIAQGKSTEGDKKGTEQLKYKEAAVKDNTGATDSLLKKVADLYAQRQLELDQGKALTDVDKLEIQVREVLKGKLLEETLARLEATRQMESQIQMRKDEAKLAAEIEKDRLEIIETLKKETASLQDARDKQAEQNLELRIGKDAYEQLTIRRMLDRAQQLEDKAVTSDQSDELRKQAQLLRERAALLQDGIVLKEAQAAAAEWAKVTDSIGQGLTDSLFRAFESGKGFFKTFWDGVVNTFKTTVLKMLVNVVMNPVNAALGSVFGAGSAVAGTGGSGLTGMASLAYQAQNFIKGAGSFLNGSMISNGAMVNTIDLGQWLGTSSNSTIAGIGNSLFSNAGSIGSALGAFGNGFAGYGISKALSGGFSVGPGNLVNVVSGIASAFLGPVAGVVGGLINRAFGRGPKEIQGHGITGTIEDGNVTGQTYQNWYKRGGWFRHSKTGTDYAPLSETVDAALDLGASKVLESTKAWAAALGLPGQELDRVSRNFTVALTGVEKDDNAAIDKLFADYQDSLTAKFEKVIAPFQQAGETVAETMQRLVILQKFSEGINEFGGIFSRLANASIDARQNIIELAGGIEKLMASAGAFVKDYYSQGEQAGMQAKGALKLFSDLGIDGSNIRTRDDFRRLVESIDVGSANGQKQLVALLDIAPQFAQLADYLKDQNKSLAQVAEQAPAVAVLNQMLPEQQSTTAAIGTVSDQIAAGNATLERIVDAVQAGNVSIASGLSAIAAQQATLADLQQRAVAEAAKTNATLSHNSANAALANSAPNYTYDIGRSNMDSPQDN